MKAEKFIAKLQRRLSIARDKYQTCEDNYRRLCSQLFVDTNVYAVGGAITTQKICLVFQTLTIDKQFFATSIYSANDLYRKHDYTGYYYHAPRSYNKLRSAEKKLLIARQKLSSIAKQVNEYNNHYITLF